MEYRRENDEKTVKSIMRRAAVLSALLITIVSVTGCATGGRDEPQSRQLQEQSAPDFSAGKNPFPSKAVFSATASETDNSPPAEGYTWQELVNLTFESNPDYAAIMAKARAEFLRYKSKTDLEDLRLSLEWSDFSKLAFGAEISFTIPNPFLNKHVIRTGEASMRKIEISAEMSKNETTALIYLLFQEIMIGEKELSILLARERLLSDWTGILKLRYDARLATQAEMNDNAFQNLKLKTAIRQSRASINAAQRSLQMLVPIPNEEIVLSPVPTDWENILAALEDEQAFIENALSRSPELAGAIAAYEKASASLSLARAKQIPWFDSVDLSYSQTNDYIDYSLLSNKWALTLNINLPVFAWFSSEKKMAAAEIEAAAHEITEIRMRIQKDITGIIAGLRETLQFLIEYKSIYDSLPEINRETIPNPESYYKILDSRLSASEHVLEIEMQCAHLYSQLLEITASAFSISA